MIHLPCGIPGHVVPRPLRARSGLVHNTRLLLFLACSMTILFVVSGCGTNQGSRMKPEAVRDSVTIHAPGEDAITWEEFIDAAGRADVVVLGEMHDDHVGHLVQRAVVEDLVSHSSNVVVAMEMLERDEQILVDDYRDGLISAEVFASRTGSSAWAGEGSWVDWYQPIIDAAHAGGGRVIAANAPRRYVRVARQDGWERLAELPDERRIFVEWPDPPIRGDYYERFRGLMNDHGEDEEMDEIADSFFRSQQTWDATMAGSVAMHHPRGGTTILLVGQFHSNNDGGTVQMLRRLMPRASILVVCLRADQDDPPDDPPPADLVVETWTEAR